MMEKNPTRQVARILTNWRAYLYCEAMCSLLVMNLNLVLKQKLDTSINLNPYYLTPLPRFLESCGTGYPLFSLQSEVFSFNYSPFL